MLNDLGQNKPAYISNSGTQQVADVQRACGISEIKYLFLKPAISSNAFNPRESSGTSNINFNKNW